MSNRKPIQLATLLLLLLLFMEASSQQESNDENNNNNPDAEEPPEGADQPEAEGPPPGFVASASYVALDGLSLVVIFDRPVGLAGLIESVESRARNAENPKAATPRNQPAHLFRGQSNQSRRFLEQCPAAAAAELVGGKLTVATDQSVEPQTTELPVQGIQLCAKLLTRKTLKLLHKFKLHDCLWTSRVQFVIRLGAPISESKVRVGFQRSGLLEGAPEESRGNEELAIELAKLPLESLGVPLAPRLALTGPNQVPPCGQFTLSAHLSSPYGTGPGEALKLEWSVGLVGGTLISSSNSSSNSNLLDQNQSQRAALLAQQIELKWKSLQQLVSSTKGNNLVLDSRLLNQSPQLYDFKVSASFATSLARVHLNASHQVSKIDFEAPIGTVYGSHLLGQQQLVNANQEVLLLADIQVPDCASNVKQVGLYWQVSEPRVRFEQTYAPYYLAKPNSLPEQSSIEFRLNSFYGIRVKKYASSGSFIATGDSILDATISDGLLVMSLEAAGEPDNNSNNNNNLVLYASVKKDESDKYTYQWSCFDGKTAAPCYRNSRGSATSGPNSTRYELAAAGQQLRPEQLPAPGNGSAGSGSGAGPLLVDKSKQRQPILRIPLGWLEPQAQLWFGLQRFDRLMPSQQSKTEYALVSVAPAASGEPGSSPVLTIGPVLIGAGRHRASIRNPLTGAVVLVADSPAVIVGRLGPSKHVKSFVWDSPNYIQPLHWTTKTIKNPLTNEEELETELHLDERLQVAHAHLQIHLRACTTSGGHISASLNLDIIEGVSQCRVEVVANKLAGALMVTLDFCNIPLGLSPMSYQIYLIDQLASEGLVESSRQSDSSQHQDEDLNEADELRLASLAKALTVPQLSPVFRITESSLQGLLAGSPKQLSRFAGRVCNRLQACRMFYSGPVRLGQLLAQLRPEPALAASSSNRSLEVAPKALLQSLQSQMESGRRANLAGNSIAAVSILNGAIELARKLLQPTTNARSNPGSRSTEQTEVESKTRELLPALLRDCLQFGYQSTQRQFHYTEPGQTSLATQTMANILQLAQANIEQKFRALRLVALISRRSIMEQLSLRAPCLADARTLQATFEAVAGTFSHYHIQDYAASGGAPDKHQAGGSGSSRQQSAGNRPGSNKQQLAAAPSSLNPFNGISMAISNSSSALFGQPARAPTSGKDVAALMAPPAPLHAQNGNKANKRKREEAILTYLRSVRQAFRSLISAAAMQLPLGASRRLAYASAGDQSDSDSKLSTSRSRPIANNNNNNGVNRPDKSPEEATRQARQQLAKTTTSSDIVSTLSHLSPSDLSSLTGGVELNLETFGVMAIRFEENIAAKLRRQLEEQRLRCRNDTTTKCSSLILAITTFAGKAPFRALDEAPSLRVPILEVSLLSPVDGSNLLDLLPGSPAATSDDSANEPASLRADDFKIYVTFHVPHKTPQAPADKQQPDGPPDRDYKCYSFDEETNEWRQPVAPAQAAAAGVDGFRLPLSCAFSSLGTFAAFQNRPPASEASVSLSIGLGLVIVIALVALLSVLGCLASNSRARARSAGSSSNMNSSADDEDDSTSSTSDRKSPRRHPEQSYRNDFNYPL